MATKPANPAGVWAQGQGGTFLAWDRFYAEGQEPVPGWNPYGSYGVNACVAQHWYYSEEEMRARAWRTVDVKGTGRIPVYFDHTLPSAFGAWNWDVPELEPEPPACDAIPTVLESKGSHMSPCINRHNGGINAVFLNWSVRKAGLKELWTLKWNCRFNTAGRWTKAGGVQSEDWPVWMRKFKDY